MKVNQLLAIGGMAAALFLSAGSVSAQNDNQGGGGGGGGQGGGRGGGFRNMDPAQRQQMMMDRVKEELNFTNATEWSAVQPLIKKVMDARQDVGFGGGMGRLFGGRNRSGGAGGDQAASQGGGNNNRRNFGQQSSPEAEALQKTIDDNAPKAQIQAALAKYQAAQKAKQAKLVQAQETLRKVLSPKQEAQATLFGLLE
jgi:hypothetical protein